jgi:hypothetical protein
MLEEKALVQGGQLLKLKQELNNLCDKFQSQQVEKDQQLQQLLYQGNTCMKSVQTIRELEALLKQLKYILSGGGEGVGELPHEQLKELADSLKKGLEQEEVSARQEYRKLLQQTTSSLLQGMEVLEELNKMAQVYQLAKECDKMIKDMAQGN